MALFETKYPNNARTISGLVNPVYQDDVSLYCDTTSAPVAVQLLAIPAGYWNTVYKIYVSDASNNAATNNITITAPTGYSINNASSITINVNGGSVIIEISADTKYNGLLNYCCSQFGNFVSILNAALNALITAGTVSKGTFYLVTDAADLGVIVLGTDTTTVSLEGRGLFLNPDYANINGNNVGVWSNALTGLVAMTSICDWNGYHWLNLTGNNTDQSPDLDSTNWRMLSKSKSNYYIEVCDFVKYDVTNNRIMYRADKYENEVDFFQQGGSPATSMNVFQWGNPLTSKGGLGGNKVLGQSYFDCINQTSRIANNSVLEKSSVTMTRNAGIISGNSFTESSALVASDNISNFTSNKFSGGSTVTLATNAGAFVKCEFGGGRTISIPNNTTDYTAVRCVSGFSNFSQNLNLDDITIFNIGTGRLTIPVAYAYCGIFYIYSASPKTIISILNLPSLNDVEFQCLSGFTENFQNSAMPASAFSLVCDSGASTNVVVGRNNGSDSTTYVLRGNLNVRKNIVILI